MAYLNNINKDKTDWARNVTGTDMKNTRIASMKSAGNERNEIGVKIFVHCLRIWWLLMQWGADMVEILWLFFIGAA